MRIYMAGTPGSQEREELAEDNNKEITFLLGYFSRTIFCSFRI